MTRIVTCEELDPVLDAYVDGELQHVGTVSEADIASHLTECRSCLEHVMIVRHLKMKLARLQSTAADSASDNLVQFAIHESQLMAAAGFMQSDCAAPAVAQEPPARA